MDCVEHKLQMRWDKEIITQTNIKYLSAPMNLCDKRRGKRRVFENNNTNTVCLTVARKLFDEREKFFYTHLMR